MPARISFNATSNDGLSTHRTGRLHQRCTVVIDKGFECDAEFTAVAKQKFMVMRNTRRACVEIKLIVEVEIARLR